MDQTGAVERAEQRLKAALDALEAAIGRKLAETESVSGLKEEAQALAEDRALLACDLDKALGRANVLEQANRQAIGRIDSAMDTVRAVLERRSV